MTQKFGSIEAIDLGTGVQMIEGMYEENSELFCIRAYDRKCLKTIGKLGKQIRILRRKLKTQRKKE